MPQCGLEPQIGSVPPFFDFDLVGILSLSDQIGEAYAIADRYRAQGTSVVLGGLDAPVSTLERCPAGLLLSFNQRTGRSNGSVTCWTSVVLPVCRGPATTWMNRRGSDRRRANSAAWVRW